MHFLSLVILALISQGGFAGTPPTMNCSVTEINSAELTSFVQRHHSELIQYNAKDSTGKYSVSDDKTLMIRQDLCRMLKLGGDKCDLKLSSDPRGSALGDGVLAIIDQGEPVFVEPVGRRMYRCLPRPDDFAYGVSETGDRQLLILARAEGSIFGALFNTSGVAKAARGSQLRGSTQTLFTADQRSINLNRLKSTIDYDGKLYFKPSVDQTNVAFGYKSAPLAPLLPAAPASATSR